MALRCLLRRSRSRHDAVVVLQAIITKEGHVKDLHVVSGPKLFQQASLDAVRQWVYRPYLLNGEPVEVETTINVVLTPWEVHLSFENRDRSIDARQFNHQSAAVIMTAP